LELNSSCMAGGVMSAQSWVGRCSDAGASCGAVLVASRRGTAAPSARRRLGRGGTRRSAGRLRLLLLRQGFEEATGILVHTRPLVRWSEGCVCCWFEFGL
jgi:hypothetical protein